LRVLAAHCLRVIQWVLAAGAAKRKGTIMPIRLIVLAITAILLTIGVLAGFFCWALPKMESPAVAGLAGTIVGGFVGMFVSVLTAIVGVWNTSTEAAERLKDWISNHALQLTQMDYELRQKSLDVSQRSQESLAPAKVYRTFYRELLELHTTGNWPKEAEELGLLSTFTLGIAKRANE
jgi:hypothetical protein